MVRFTTFFPTSCDGFGLCSARHEHYYVKIIDHLIRADEIPTDQTQLLKMFGSSTVILATLSMLSNPVLTHKGVFRLVPVETLVVDEASQINIVEYMVCIWGDLRGACTVFTPGIQHIFGNLKRLRKVCFFGDPKQCTSGVCHHNVHSDAHHPC